MDLLTELHTAIQRLAKGHQYLKIRRMLAMSRFFTLSHVWTVEICAELMNLLPKDVTAGHDKAWLEYYHYFNASGEEQASRFGRSFVNLILRRGHSRLIAYASKRSKSSELWSSTYFESMKGREAHNL